MENYYSVAEAAAYFETSEFHIQSTLHHYDFLTPNTKELYGAKESPVSVAQGDPFVVVADDHSVHVSNQGMILLAMHLNGEKARAKRIEIAQNFNL